MKYKILILVLFLTIGGYGQIDTLAVNFTPSFYFIEQLVDSIPNYKGRCLSINLISEEVNLPYDPIKVKRINRTFKRQVQTYISSLNKRLPEVKVLYILNPTVNGYHHTTENEPIDSLYAPIYKIDFTKLTSLEVIYLVGDDTDYIVEFPAAFYKTPIKIIHCAQMANYEKLKQNVLNKNEAIKVIRDTQEDRDYYINFF